MKSIRELICKLSIYVSSREIQSLYKEEDEDSLVKQSDGKRTKYRKRAFENYGSGEGKYQCIRCKKWFEKVV